MLMVSTRLQQVFQLESRKSGEKASSYRFLTFTIHKILTYIGKCLLVYGLGKGKPDINLAN